MKSSRKPRMKEENVIVLDFLQHGHHFEEKRIPIAQCIGKNHLILLEVVPKRGVTLRPGEEVYIGDGKREKVHHVVGKINYDKLTETAKMEFEEVMKKMIDKNIEEWIEIFNKAGPISTRLHQLELLPGIGKKHMWEIIEERDVEPFKDFEDLKERVSLMPDPKETILKRIKMELQNKDKYRLFVK